MNLTAETPRKKLRAAPFLLICGNRRCAEKNEGTKSNGSKYSFRNGPLGQGLSPFETYTTQEKPARMGF